jgi:hypothetical protein
MSAPKTSRSSGARPSGRGGRRRRAPLPRGGHHAGRGDRRPRFDRRDAGGPFRPTGSTGWTSRRRPTSTSASGPSRRRWSTPSASRGRGSTTRSPSARRSSSGRGAGGRGGGGRSPLPRAAAPRAGSRARLAPVALSRWPGSPGARRGCAGPSTGSIFSPAGRIGTSNEVTGPVRLSFDGPGMIVITPRAALERVSAALAG